MPDLMQSTREALTAIRRKVMGATVAYQRGPLELSVVATIGRSEFDLEDGEGVVQRVQVKDFLIDAEDLTFGEPMPGDIIAEGGRQYRVAPFTGLPAWRFTDGYRRVYRIHTKETGEAS
jgi:hypothetical protein